MHTWKQNTQICKVKKKSFYSLMPGMVAHICNPGTREAKTEKPGTHESVSPTGELRVKERQYLNGDGQQHS